MKVNPYYNKDTMNLKQLAFDLEKQGFICRLSKDCDTLIIQHFNYYLGFVEISMTGFKDWRVLYYDASKKKLYFEPSKRCKNLQCLNKLVSNQVTQKAFTGCKIKIAQHTAGLSLITL